MASIESSNSATAVTDLAASRPRSRLASIARVSWRSAALALLLAGVSLEQPAFELGGLTIKPEQVALLIVWALVGWRLIATGRLARARLLLWTIPYIGVLLVASLLNAPDSAVALRHTVMVALVTSAAWLAFGLVDSEGRLALAVEMLIALAVAEAALTFGVLAFARQWVPPGAQIGLGGIAVPNGTLWEPNLLGSYVMAGAVLALAALLAAAPQARRRAAWLAGGLALMIAALGLSLARGAWLGFAAGVIVVAIGQVALRGRGVHGAGAVRRNIALALLAAALAGIFLVAVAPVIFPGTAAGFHNRVDLGSYNPRTDPSLRSRTDSLQQALPGIAAHPILGNGAGSFGITYQDTKGNPGWIANLELHVLYDSGLVGLACWLVGLVWLFRSGIAGLRRTAATSPALVPTTLGLVAAQVALLVAFQATEGSWLAFPWVYIGLLAWAAMNGAAQREM